MIKVFVPRDAAALSMGADDVAKAIAAEAKKRNTRVEIVRNGSRGMLWLEPLVEVETAKGRVAYGPVDAEPTCRACSRPSFLKGGKHKLVHGLTDEIPYFKNQERLTFARCGITDPLSIDDYRAHGGFEGLTKALTMKPHRHRHRGHDLGPARPRRRRLPDRHQVEDRPRHQGRPEVHLLQRRRRRQRHLRRPHADGRRSVLPHRRHDHRRHRRSAPPRATSTSAPNTRTPSTCMREAIEIATEGQLARRHHPGLATRSSSSSSAWAPAPTSAAKKPRCWKASRASAASCATSRRSRPSKACSASRPSSTTC